MKYLWLSLYTVFSLNIFCSELPENYYKSWGHTKLYKTRVAGVEISMKGIRRFMHLGSKPFPIADITYTRLSGSGVSGDIAQIAGDITSSFGRIAWDREEMDNGVILRAFWTRGNRDLQIMLLTLGLLSFLL